MLSSKRDRFVWSKQDRLPDMSLFRLLHQNWHPITRVVLVEERAVRWNSRASPSPLKSTPQLSAKASWTPWLWIGS